MDDGFLDTLAKTAKRVTLLVGLNNKNQYVNVFDFNIIPEESSQKITEFYKEYIKDIYTTTGKTPKYHDVKRLIDIIANNLTDEILKGLTADSTNFQNPFDTSTNLSFVRKEDIPNIVKELVMAKFLDWGIVEQISPPSNTAFSSAASNIQDNIVTDGQGNLADTSQFPPINQQQIPGSNTGKTFFEPLQQNSKDEISFWLKMGDATNPNTILAYYFVKMRDYLRSMKRFLAFVRFYHGSEKEHTLVTMKKVTDTTQYNVVHPFAKMNGRALNSEEVERIAKCMNAFQIQSYLFNLK